MPQAREPALNTPVSALSLAILLLATVTVANAAEPDSNPPEVQVPGIAVRADRALQITPYLWAAELHGRISPFRRGPTIGVDKPFSEVLDNLKFGGFIDVWARSGRYVLSGDFAYVDTKENKTFGPLPGIGPLPPGIRAVGRVDSKLFTATLLGGYRVVDTSDWTLDALAGLRFWHVSNKVRVSALEQSRSYKESFGWAEPVLGVRAFTNLSDQLSMQAQANIGGMGIGSRFAWSAQATMNYIINKNFSISAGYKVLDVNYNRNGHVYDTRLHGPVLGLTYRF